MRKFVIYGLLILALVTFIIWIVIKSFPQILPQPIYADVVLFIAILIGLSGIFSGIKDFAEFLRSIFGSKSPKVKPTKFTERARPLTSSGKLSSFKDVKRPNDTIHQHTDSNFIKAYPDGNVEVNVSSKGSGSSMATIESIQIKGGTVEVSPSEITWETTGKTGEKVIRKETIGIGYKQKGKDQINLSGKIEHHNSNENIHNE